MAFLVSVRPLRRHGVRLNDLESPREGYFSVRRQTATCGLVLISNIGGVVLLGPLYEPRVLNASIDGLVLLGYERESNAAYVQEWLIGRFDGCTGGKKYVSAGEGQSVIGGTIGGPPLRQDTL